MRRVGKGHAKMRRWIAIAIVAVGAAVVPTAAIILHEPAIDAGESGTFANDCCGTVELSKG